jgi:hypothetical protein
MKLIKALIPVLLAFIINEKSPMIYAQEIDFSFSGSYRLRGEIQNDYNIKKYATSVPEDFVLSRLRADFGLGFFENLNLHLQLQDARAWGFSIPDEKLTGNNPVRDYMDVNQLYISYDNNFIKFKFGRQQLSYRDSRVFGPGNWGNTGRYVWDAGVLTFNNEYFKSDFIVGRYVLHNPDIWLNKFFNDQVPTAYALYNTVKRLPFDMDVFYVLKKDNRGITQGESGTGNLTSQSIGFWLNGNYNQWQYCTMLAGQFGKYGSDRISSLGLFLSLGYTFNISWNPNVQVQYTYGSGDKNPSDGNYNTFDGIFGGADSKLYGWMNLFFWKNLTEYRINFTLTPEEDFSLRAEYHYLTLSEAKDAWYFPGNAQRRDKEGKSGIELGHEIDFSAKKKIFPFLELQTGYSFFLPGEFVKNTGDSPFTDWYFLETTIYF